MGGVPSIVLDGKTGLLVTPDDVEALAAALERVLVDTSLAADLADAGAALVRQNHDLQQSLAKYRDVYEAALASSRG